jgi:E3 ubiquitin-protein ligase NEDD4
MTDGCEPPCGCWELNSKPLEEQSVLLTTEPFLKRKRNFAKVIFCTLKYATIAEGHLERSK